MMIHWIGQKLNDIFGPLWAPYVGYILVGLVIITLVVVMAVISIYLERKIAAFMQMRLGPMRVGKWGTLQAFADVFKLMLKESLTPAQADKQLFHIAPYLVLTVSFLAFAPIAFSPTLQLWDMNIGVLYITSISSVGVIGILMAGWSSNNKYSLLGAMRSGAQIVSYELSAGIAILTIVMMSGSLSVSGIIQSQADGWWIFKGHIPAIIAFVIFAIASTAELNRAPFDLAEAEQELTAGFHTEYSGMQFAMFFLAEYTNMFIVSMLGTTLFLGGWMPLHIANWETFNHLMDKIPPFLWFFGKVFISLFMIIWFRWTFPRLRIDQLLKLEWKYLLPIGMVNLVIGAIVTWLGWIF
ncbi:MAG: NADH-quinone oxidoreductase subunit NuoH [Bacteroidales bacterium]|nr:NADH-quinone oxidoreductase subunit NuoH [Bacteroidales bacterium]HPO65956.1 NADH-quinone oxidoreductase subunit NuoH [Bacteroidales bacterium]